MKFMFRNYHCKVEKGIERIRWIQGDQLRGSCSSLGKLCWADTSGDREE